MLSDLHVALVHDWLFGMRGGERCLEDITALFDRADIFTLFYEPAGISDALKRQRIEPSCLNLLPWKSSLYRHLLPCYGIGTRDLSRRIAREHYDLVISISHCAAKNVEVLSPHLCYCLTPARYLWDQYDRYFGGRAIEPGVRLLRPLLQRWDIEGAAGVGHFVAISRFVRDRIRRVYARDAEVIYPPVRHNWIRPRRESEDGEGFLCVNALVPYKNVELIVDAFTDLGEALTVVGRGPEERRLRARAGKNIQFLSRLRDEELAQRYRAAKALVFAAEEDFGMVPVEMLAAGRPVIAFARGGVLETVTPRTGILFPELSKEYIVEAVRTFLREEGRFQAGECVRQSEVFSPERFSQSFEEAVSRFLRSPGRVTERMARC